MYCRYVLRRRRCIVREAEVAAQYYFLVLIGVLDCRVTKTRRSVKQGHVG